MQVGLEEQLGPYQKRIPIITRSVKGRFRHFKSAMLALAWGVYFMLPWMPWGRVDGPGQPVAFDLPGRRFYLFDLIVYPQDVAWLAILLFIAAVLLFFVTTLVGRAFCGYFCFQTLWTDAYMLIEHLIQGERPARIRLSRQPWNTEKWLRVGSTHAVWLVLALVTALTFILYFGDSAEITRNFFTGSGAGAAYLTVGVLTLSTYLAAGLMREQVCIYVCPYGRFQSAMYDTETLTVHYDAKRGEGRFGRAAARAGLRAHQERADSGHGDCIDCGLCVQVCPAGIDIRQGMQYRCISCGLCIDACDSIMDSMGYPRGLIRYDSELNLARSSPEKPRLHWKRLKVLGYGAAMVCMTLYLGYSVTGRSSYDGMVSQVRQPLFVTLSDGRIRNRYEIRITNKSRTEQTFHIGVRGLPASALDLGYLQGVRVKSGRSVVVPASIQLPPAQAARIDEFGFVITPLSKPGETQVETVHFHSGRRPG